jgi:hypothetical protein
MSDGRSTKGICELIIAKNREGPICTKEFIADLWCSNFRSNYGNTTGEQDADNELDGMPF